MGVGAVGEGGEFATKGAVAAEVALSGLYVFAWGWGGRVDGGPDFDFGVGAVEGGKADQSIVQLGFVGENIVGRAGYPAV